MPGLFGTPNLLSIGPAKDLQRTLLGMPATPTTRLSKRLLAVRRAAGFGGKRQAAEFARKIGISAASLHDLESGKSQDLGKSLQGYILGVGANPFFILQGKGAPVIKDVEKNLRAQTLMMLLLALDEKEIDTVENIVRAFIKAHPTVSAEPHFDVETDLNARRTLE